MNPGQLFEAAVEEMNRFLASRGEAVTGSSAASGRFVTYLLSVVLPQYSQGALPKHHIREMRTICEALDALTAGKVLRVADLLVQRLKALEVAAGPGGWGMAVHHELIPLEGSGLYSQAEQALAARKELLRLKLRETQAKARESEAKPG